MGTVLTTFEWALIGAIGTILVAAIGALLGLFIKSTRDRMDGEAASRRAGDLQLAEALEKVADKLHATELQNATAHGTFVKRDSVSPIHEKLEAIAKDVAAIKVSMVTKEECLGRCGS